MAEIFLVKADWPWVTLRANFTIVKEMVLGVMLTATLAEAVTPVAGMVAKLVKMVLPLPNNEASDTVARKTIVLV